MLYQTIVLGAGAAGLFFAATRQNSGPVRLPVLLVDRQERPGRKILLSGGGKCNVTNRVVTSANYLGADPAFTRQALAAFTPEDMLAWLKRQNIATEEREHGQIFCRQGAEGLRDALFAQARQNGADFVLGVEIKSVRRIEEGEARFALESSGKAYQARNLLIACGGPAWPRAGAGFLGRQLAARFGHAYIQPRPALTPLKMPEDWPLHGLQGISLPVEAKAPRGPAFRLPLLFTHVGLSGPAALQASSYLEPGESLQINFLPDHDLAALLDAEARQTPFGLLRRLLPGRLALALLSASNLGPALAPLKDRKNAELSRAARAALAEAAHRHAAAPLAPGFEQAESSSGGIATREVNPETLESRLVPGLYFAGEVLDICGQLGGYNLHWAWASARLAGRRI